VSIEAANFAADFTTFICAHEDSLKATNFSTVKAAYYTTFCATIPAAF